ncbi:MAG TPA: chemotaxis response regulator protein-glutamate methylesterase [Chryseosolibacter sp.]
MSRKKIRVLIVDDSAVVRQTLAHILESDPEVKVLATASDPFIAAQKISHELPDVITLDVEMPRMDGITFLKKIMSQHPIPVVIISSLTAKGTETAIHALELGAIDVLKKPVWNRDYLSDAELRIIEVVKAASKAVIKRKAGLVLRHAVADKPAQNFSMIRTTEKIVVVGASTGGTEAILQFLEAMPIDCPGIVIVQHMPESFTKSFADRLNRICKITVREAVNGESILKGQALIAPGNKHLEVKRSGARYYVEVRDGEPVNRHRPSVDVMFLSAAKYAGRNSIGIIMTGMGADGAKGMLELKIAGAQTVAQDEKTSIVFGMPKEAIKLNAVDKILPLPQIAPWVVNNL